MTKIAIPIVCISPIAKKQGIIYSNFSMGKDTFQLPVHGLVTSVDWHDLEGLLYYMLQ